jgi:hypothetical protein
MNDLLGMLQHVVIEPFLPRRQQREHGFKSQSNMCFGHRWFPSHPTPRANPACCLSDFETCLYQPQSSYDSTTRTVRAASSWLSPTPTRASRPPSARCSTPPGGAAGCTSCAARWRMPARAAGASSPPSSPPRQLTYPAHAVERGELRSATPRRGTRSSRPTSSH